MAHQNIYMHYYGIRQHHRVRKHATVETHTALYTPKYVQRVPEILHLKSAVVVVGQAVTTGPVRSPTRHESTSHQQQVQGQKKKSNVPHSCKAQPKSWGAQVTALELSRGTGGAGGGIAACEVASHAAGRRGHSSGQLGSDHKC